MFRNVLVGVDGRQGGRDAIALAGVLASPDAAITLAHDYGSDWMLGRGAGLVVTYAREESERLLATERDTAEIEADLVCSPCGNPGRALHELAERRGADLIVVGSSRHALLGRALIGDDTRAALNGAPCAIAIAPRGYTQMDRRLAKIGVGYDGSAEGEYALAAARELASRDGAKINALWVVSMLDVREQSPIPADWPHTTEVLVSRCLEQLEHVSGIEADATYGGPREELSKLGDRVDLLILGSRRYGPIHRLFHGTTSTYLTRHTSCPLLVLPRVGAAVAQNDASTAPATAETPHSAPHGRDSRAAVGA